MQTLYLKVDPDNPDPAIIEMAASLVKRGEAVAFPTETVYGVGANAGDEEAVGRVFAAKARSMDNPLLVHVSSWEEAAELVTEFPEEVMLLVKRFWPGPLTLVALSRNNVPELVRAGLPTVGLRMPDHRVALDLIRAAGAPIAATSANLSGRPSPTAAEHVKNDLDGRIAALIDGGVTGWGIESTILDVTRRPFAILRPGAVSRERLEEVIPGLIKETRSSKGETANAPHYQPQARVIPVKYGSSLTEPAQIEIGKGMRVGMVAVSDQETPSDLELAVFIRGGSSEYGRLLYDIFRTADDKRIDCLFMETPEETGLGAAVADRIREAARR